MSQSKRIIYIFYNIGSQHQNYIIILIGYVPKLSMVDIFTKRHLAPTETKFLIWEPDNYTTFFKMHTY